MLTPFIQKRIMDRLNKFIEQMEKTGGTIHNIEIDGVNL